ncbi:hypothetical protein EYF80_004251 [Liparis tanakae]|uniref:Uncharacterized protein n=1 Tax=Liparis tanakae TaxID=230148 RepID=A0A4Z2J7F8_9TELE|nr:hypothetical protein EYF80_004251 [Liparis tanakae]
MADLTACNWKKTRPPSSRHMVFSSTLVIPSSIEPLSPPRQRTVLQEEGTWVCWRCSRLRCLPAVGELQSVCWDVLVIFRPFGAALSSAHLGMFQASPSDCHSWSSSVEASSLRKRKHCGVSSGATMVGGRSEAQPERHSEQRLKHSSVQHGLQLQDVGPSHLQLHALTPHTTRPVQQPQPLHTVCHASQPLPVQSTTNTQDFLIKEKGEVHGQQPSDRWDLSRLSGAFSVAPGLSKGYRYGGKHPGEAYRYPGL